MRTGAYGGQLSANATEYLVTSNDLEAADLAPYLPRLQMTHMVKDQDGQPYEGTRTATIMVRGSSGTRSNDDDVVNK